jgi:hypothetical protein
MCSSFREAKMERLSHNIFSPGLIYSSSNAKEALILLCAVLASLRLGSLAGSAAFTLRRPCVRSIVTLAAGLRTWPLHFLENPTSWGHPDYQSKEDKS